MNRREITRGNLPGEKAPWEDHRGEITWGKSPGGITGGVHLIRL